MTRPRARRCASTTARAAGGSSPDRSTSSQPSSWRGEPRGRRHAIGTVAPRWRRVPREAAAGRARSGRGRLEGRAWSRQSTSAARWAEHALGWPSAGSSARGRGPAADDRAGVLLRAGRPRGCRQGETVSCSALASGSTTRTARARRHGARRATSRSLRPRAEGAVSTPSSSRSRSATLIPSSGAGYEGRSSTRHRRPRQRLPRARRRRPDASAGDLARRRQAEREETGACSRWLGAASIAGAASPRRRSGEVRSPPLPNRRLGRRSGSMSIEPAPHRPPRS